MSDARDVVTDTDGAFLTASAGRVLVADAVGSGPGGVVPARGYGTPVGESVPLRHE